MGRAIQMENDIEKLSINVQKLQREIDSLKDMVSTIIDLAQGGDSEPKKTTRKKKTKASDGAKGSISGK